MAELGAEGVVDAVMAALQFGLAAKLVEVDGRYTAVVGLEDMAEWRIDDPLGGRLPDKLPVGWVLVPEIRVDEWGGWGQDFTPDVVVWVLLRESDPHRLRQRMYRTVQAVWEVLRESSDWQIVEQAQLDFSAIVSTPDYLYGDARVRVRMSLKELA